MATDQLEQAVKLAPNALRSWHLLAQIHRSQGNQARADEITKQIQQLQAKPQQP